MGDKINDIIQNNHTQAEKVFVNHFFPLNCLGKGSIHNYYYCGPLHFPIMEHKTGRSLLMNGDLSGKMYS